MASKVIKIAWFPSTASKEIVLSSNGKCLDEYFTKCEVEESSYNYVLDGTALKDIHEFLNEEDILKVKIDYGFEIFRISKVTTSTRYITIVARQIAIADSLSLYLEDVRPENVSGQGALSHLLANTTGTKEITLSSNITTSSTAYYQDMSLYKALFDADNSFIKRWGGEVQFRGYTITINTSVGSNRGVSIREKKNLAGFSGTSNLDNLITRARGKGFNGIKGNWINSPIQGNYAHVYSKTIEYQDVKVKTDSDTTSGYETEALAIAELDRRIALEYSDNDIDKLKATYTINFVELGKTEEYKNYIQAERVYIGDVIRVYIPNLNIDVDVRVIDRKFDILSTATKETKLSNVTEEKAISMNSIINDLKKQYANTNNDSIASYVDAIIKAGMQGSYLTVRENELLVMDTKDINTAINVTRLNKNGLGFSKTGYYGHYDYGFTSDGKINASLIATGILSTVIIQNADGSFQIDLSKTGGASFFNVGKKAIEISNNSLKFFDWKLATTQIGTIGSLNYSDDGTQPFLGIYNEKNSGIFIGYKKPDGSLYPYIQFDKYNIWESSIDKAIKIFETVLFCDAVNFASMNNKMGGLEVAGNITCNSLNVLSADKHRVIETSRGKVGINALETPKVMNMDVGRNKLDDSGKCVIPIESLFSECIETDDYDITLTKYGKGDVWVQEMNLDSFLVCGTPNLKFSWTIIATQKGCKGIRLKKIEDNEMNTERSMINE